MPLMSKFISVNEDPVFLQTGKITKLPNEDLVVRLEAQDPEDRPLFFNKVFSTGLDIEVDPDGTLYWPTRSNQSE